MFYSRENRPRGWRPLLQVGGGPRSKCPLNTSPSPVLRPPGPPPSAAQGSQMEGATSINHLVLILPPPPRAGWDRPLGLWTPGLKRDC